MRDLVTEARVEQCIPNDCDMEGDRARIHLITGPNSSGKSSYVRAVCSCGAQTTCMHAKHQVTTVVHLAHVGSFVPAQSATVGLTDRIIARTSAPSAPCGAGRSTFAADLAHVAVMLRHATGALLWLLCVLQRCSAYTGRTLCVLDEFGKGTLAADGAGLLAGCLQHWAGAEGCPKVLACTHFLELAARDDLLPRWFEIDPKVTNQ